MIAARFHRFEEVESTNDVALEMAKRGEPEGAVVTAAKQMKGRGRLGRSWWDTKGESAILSVLLRPPKPSAELGQLAFVAGLAVARSLERDSCPNVELKWPNDVLINGKKAVGILVETEPAGNDIIAVIGIGINVNQREFPPEIAQTATSLAIETGTARDPQELAEHVAVAVLADYEAYLAHGFEDILASWRKYMWGLGMQASVRVGDETVAGKIAGVDPHGALLIKDSRGTVQVIHAADTIRLLTL